jgi:hypothetical protein
MNPRGVRECCALLAFASPAAVLAEAGEAEPQRLDKVEIVGSHLTRSVDHEGPTPISIYRRDDIEASGAMRLSDFLLALRIASAGGFDDRGTGFNFHTGAAALSLRGLGPGRDLGAAERPAHRGLRSGARQRRHLCRSERAACACRAGAPCSLAQQDNPAPVRLEAIEVVGSHLKRTLPVARLAAFVPAFLRFVSPIPCACNSMRRFGDSSALR